MPPRPHQPGRWITPTLAAYYAGCVLIGCIGLTGYPSPNIGNVSWWAAIAYSGLMVGVGALAIASTLRGYRRSEVAAVATIAALSLEHAILIVVGSHASAGVWQTAIRIGIAPLMMLPFAAYRVRDLPTATYARIAARSRLLDAEGGR